VQKAIPPCFACLMLLTGLMLLTSGIAAAQSASNQKVIGGPYVVNAGQRSATVMWVVETGQVSIGAAPGEIGKTAPALHAEKVEFSGLKPATTYYYQAFPGEGGKGSFKTAPPREVTKFQFVVYGDTRTRHDVHRSVINAVLKYSNPDFVLHTGDLVENGADTSLWPIFFDAERELLRKVAFFPALGNHERHAENYSDYMDVKPYYSFNWGNAHFSVLDTDIGTVSGTKADQEAFWKEETKWLENDLAQAKDAGFRFVFGHHPPMTAVKRRQGDNAHMTALEPMFQKHRVSAAFFGHDHNYQHYLKDGVHYFITGGGGAPLYDVDMPPAGVTIKVASTENFVMVNVDGNVAHVAALKPNGSKIDSIDIGQ